MQKEAELGAGRGLCHALCPQSPAAGTEPWRARATGLLGTHFTDPTPRSTPSATREQGRRISHPSSPYLYGQCVYFNLVLYF